MRFTRLILPGLAVAASAYVMSPGSAAAYTLLGHNLNTSNRTVRLFNNFTAAGANNNTTPDSNWPGYDGAEMALWKACAEWGSWPFGTGAGDPTQTQVGDGNANFDICWSGNATGIGVIGNNIMSQIPGSSGGVLAFMQGNGNGWWIRFYQNWSWADGPGAVSGGEADLQSIGCHEYGHALGLGHSAVGNATMFASASLGSVSLRSIESDDRAGLAAIYGAKSGTKPRITSVVAGSQLKINGTNLPATCEVWFTSNVATSTGSKLAVRVLGIPSSGTQLTVTLPANAGPGNVLVKNQSSGAHSALSNAFPVDPNACQPGTDFCTSKLNSLGCLPDIGSVGTPSVSATSGFFVNCTNVRNGKAGMLVYSVTGPNSVPFLGGTLCVAIQIKRTPARSSNGTLPPASDCSGIYLIDFAQFAAGLGGGSPLPALQTAGTPVWAQWWSRDQGFPAPNNIGLSNGHTWVQCP